MAQDALISIVDDDDSFRTALVGLVRSLGWRATGFGSAEAFLAADEARAGACLITDIHMPGLSGIELAQRLRQEGCDIPVILVTARTELSLHERASACGALCVLKKPFGAQALIDALATALANKTPPR